LGESLCGDNSADANAKVDLSARDGRRAQRRGIPFAFIAGIGLAVEVRANRGHRDQSQQ
jgi:hypothetical protein